MGDTSTPIRSEKLWFDDGDIVLIVAEDDAEHHFRVHRAILVIHSPVFRDMFSMSPQSSGGESLPVPLLDDSVLDVTALLKELYCGRVAQIATFDGILGILRLSHKYQIIGLQERMKRKLLEDWPLNYSEYLARLTYIGSQDNRISEALKLIETAQRCHENELLPTAFYELACAWGTRWPELAPNLSLENTMRLWVGRARAEQRLRWFVVAEGCYNRRSAKCAYPSALQTKLAKCAFDGLSAHASLRKSLQEGLDKLCLSCYEFYKIVLEKKSQELWENIPADFDLPAIDLKLYSQRNINKPA